jgi:hypothetical protein
MHQTQNKRKGDDLNTKLLALIASIIILTSVGAGAAYSTYYTVNNADVQVDDSNVIIDNSNVTIGQNNTITYPDSTPTPEPTAMPTPTTASTPTPTHTPLPSPSVTVTVTGSNPQDRSVFGTWAGTGIQNTTFICTVTINNHVYDSFLSEFVTTQNITVVDMMSGMQVTGNISSTIFAVMPQLSINYGIASNMTISNVENGQFILTFYSKSPSVIPTTGFNYSTLENMLATTAVPNALNQLLTTYFASK